MVRATLIRAVAGDCGSTKRAGKEVGTLGAVTGLIPCTGPKHRHILLKGATRQQDVVAKCKAASARRPSEKAECP